MKQLTNYKHILLLLTLFLVAPVAVDANTVLRTGETVSVTQDQVVEGDFYVLAGDVSMSGNVSEDFYVAAGTLTSNGSVGADMFAIAGSAHLHASVTDDVRLIAGEVVVAEDIEGDLVMIGGMLKVLSTATISGDILFFGGEVEVNGPVGGSVLGVYEHLRIDAPVTGNVDVTAGKLVLGEQANIQGKVDYKSAQELVRAQGASIVGEISRNRATDDSDSTDPRAIARAILIPLFMSLFAALSLYLVARRFINHVVVEVEERPAMSLAFGAATLLVGPFVIVLFLATILGGVVGVLLLFLYFLFAVLAYVLAQIGIGVLLFRVCKFEQTLTPLSIGVGVVVSHLCMAIPLVGPLVIITFIAIGVGALVCLTYRSIV